MTRRRIVLATGNRAKRDLFDDLLPSAWEVVAYDPKEAEETSGAATYEDAALAKARAAGARYIDLPAIGHDSGLEFAALGNRPGPRTRDWLARRAGRRLIERVAVGSRVDLVHAVAVVYKGDERVFAARDARTVARPIRIEDEIGLPLTKFLEGERRALTSVLGWVELRLAGALV